MRLKIQVESTTKVKLVVYTKPDRNRKLANAKLVVNTKPDRIRKQAGAKQAVNKKPDQKRKKTRTGRRPTRNLS